MGYGIKFLKQNTLFLLIFCISCTLFGQGHHYFPDNTGTLEIFENYHVRNKYRDILLSSIHHARTEQESVHNQKDFFHRVKFQIVEKNNALFFLFLNERESGFPMIGRGNVSVKRSLKDGHIIQMTIIIRDHNECYIRLTPHENRTLLDLFLYGIRIYHDVVIPIDLTSLIFESFAGIVNLTADIIDWDVVLSSGYENKTGLEVIEKVRKFLPRLNTIDDGAMARTGEYVFIRDLHPQPEPGGFNCSGFTKWFVDGFYYPLTGEYTDISALKDKHLDYRGNRWSVRYEEERDPYFGLDWTRNLAMELYKARTGRKNVNPEMFDTRDVPFLDYIEDVGYSTEVLELVLFLLASVNPDCFYLGSINQKIGKNPGLQQHFHVALFFPYFTGTGKLKIIVLEKNKEITLPSFLVSYGNNFIHLVKIEIKGEFNPPPVYSGNIR